MDIKDAVESAVSNWLNEISESAEETLLSQMKDQPYSCTCTACGEDLEVNTTVDDDGDLIMKVEPCSCQYVQDVEDCEFVCEVCGTKMDVDIVDEVVTIKPCVYCKDNK